MKIVKSFFSNWVNFLVIWAIIASVLTKNIGASLAWLCVLASDFSHHVTKKKCQFLEQQLNRLCDIVTKYADKII